MPADPDLTGSGSGARGALGPQFRRLWTSNALANLADGISFVVVPLLAVSITDDPMVVAGLSGVHAVVRLLVVLPVGGLVDRWDRRTVLWASNGVRAALFVVLAVLVGTGAATIPTLYVVFALVGAVETAADNAAVSVLPAVVAPDRLDRANGQVAGAQLVADEFVGPPLGGLLFAAAVVLPVAAVGGLYALAAVAALSVRGSFRPDRLGPVDDPGPGSLAREVSDGVRWLAGHRLLAALAGIGGIASVAYMAPFSVLVLYADERLGLDPAGYGLLLSASALGGLLGSAVVAPVRRRIGYSATITASLALGAGTLGALAITTSAWVAGLLLAAYIFHAVVWGVCVTSLRQRLVPDPLRGRVNAASRLLGLAGLAVGAVVGGFVASRLSLEATFVVGSVLFAGCAVLGWIATRGVDEG